MNFTITIHGEGPELTGALMKLREVMEGNAIQSGEVSATYSAPTPAAAPAQPLSPAPTPFPQQPIQHAPFAPEQPYLSPQQHQAYQQFQAPAPTGVPVSPPPAQPVQPSAPIPGAVPTAAPAYTMQQLAVAATPLMDAGRGQELTGILKQFGVESLTQLPPDHYGAFATALRQLGAKI